MNEYTFGEMSYSGGQPQDGQNPGYGEGQQGQQGPKWFRDYMETASKQIKLLEQQLAEANETKRQASLTQIFEDKGYAASAAALYTGDPAQVDEWLSAHGAALARKDQVPPAAPPVPGEMPPAGSAIPPAAQADLQKMQSMGSQTAAAPGSSGDDELAAALRATSSPEEFAQVAAAHGWQYNLSNMGQI
jgi:hypothetical protein